VVFIDVVEDAMISDTQLPDRRHSLEGTLVSNRMFRNDGGKRFTTPQPAPVIWPNAAGTKETFRGLEPGEFYWLREGAASRSGSSGGEPPV
jgi:hypothetical protein